MKTIKQIAEEVGVSKQAVQKRIVRDPLYTRLSPYIYTEKGVKYIDETGERLIKSVFIKNSKEAVSIDTAIDKNKESIDLADNQRQNVYSNVHSDIIKILQDNIAVLQNQLETKDRQIEDLTSTIKTQAESINLDRKNELAETLVDGQYLLSGNQPSGRNGESKSKRSFLKNFFGRKYD